MIEAEVELGAQTEDNHVLLQCKSRSGDKNRISVEAERERTKGSLFFQMPLLPTSFCHFLKQLAHMTMA